MKARDRPVPLADLLFQALRVFSEPLDLVRVDHLPLRLLFLAVRLEQPRDVLQSGQQRVSQRGERREQLVVFLELVSQLLRVEGHGREGMRVESVQHKFRHSLNLTKI